MRAETADVIAAAGNKTTVAGAITSFFGWATVNEIVAVGGFMLALLGFAVNWYYRHVHDLRERERHAAEMKRITGESHGE